MHRGKEVIVLGGALFFACDIGFKSVLHVSAEVASGIDGIHGVEEALKVFLHLAGVLVTDMEIACEGLHDDGIELLGDLGVDSARWYGFGFADLFEGMEVAFTDKQALSREDLVQDDTDTEDIGALIEREPLDLFGGHVAEFTFEDTGLCACGLALGLGDAKVDDLDIAVVGDEDVLWRDIAVDDV